LNALVAEVTTGVSVNSESRPRRPGELGVLKTSAVTYGVFRPEENKVVAASDRHRAREHPKSGCVLFSRMNTLNLVGASAFVECNHQDLVLPDRIWQLRPADSADGRWLHKALSSPATRAQLSELASGTSGSMKNIPQQRLLELVLLTPPVPEQRKIAAILSTVDDAIDATQAVIDQLGVVKKAMMAELLTRGLPGRHTRFKKTEIGEVPDRWDLVPAAVLALPGGMVGGPFGSDLTTKDYVAGPGVPVIRGGNVSMGSFSDAELVYVSSEKASALARNSAQRGDVVMTQRGASLGESTLIPADSQYESYIISQTMMRMTPDPTKLSARFLLHYICSAPAQAWLQAHQVATGQPHLNLGIFRDMPIVVPGRDEQDAIARTVDAIDETDRREQGQLIQLRALKSSLMSVLLTGEVRVKPDEDAA
jgi:type I restriction enzyme S subunit